MNKTILRKTSNPKSPDEYSKMFDKFFKSIATIESKRQEAIEKFDLKNIQESILKKSKVKSVHELSQPQKYDFNVALHVSEFKSDALSMKEKEIKTVIGEALFFHKNDRIESYLKYLRNQLYYCIILTLTEWKNLSIVEQLQPALDWYCNELEAIYNFCVKETGSYNSKNKDSTYLNLHPLSSFDSFRAWEIYIFNRLKHYIDLYNSDKDRYREINDFSWANKTLDLVNEELQAIEQVIKNSKEYNKEEYMRQMSKASPTEVYLEVDSKYTWYVIENYKCSFEAYLNNHCGTDSNADVLFSLRSVDKNNMFDSHVTISASITKTKDSAIFIVLQVKGKGNDKPNERYWPYIIELFKQEEFGWQEISSYRSDSDFHISDLDEATRNKFLKIKPWWNNLLKAYIHYDLLKGKSYFNAKDWKAQKFEIDKDTGDVTITYDYFEKMVKALDSIWPSSRVTKGRVLHEANKYLNNYETVTDYSAELDDEQGRQFLDEIKELKPEVYKKLESLYKDFEYQDIWDMVCNSKDSYCRDVFNAINGAYLQGWEAGTMDSIFHYYENHFDGIEIELDGEQYGRIDKTEKGWEVTIYYSVIENYSSENNSIGIPDPDLESFDFARGDDYFEHDYDSNAAVEYLLENLPD